MRRLAGSGGVVLVVLSIAGSATSAAHAQSIDGRVRLGFEGAMLQHQVLNADTNGNETEQKLTYVGPGAAPVGLIVGYGLSESLLLGAQVTAFNQNVSFGGSSSRDVLTIGLHGTLSYVVGNGDVRPFFGPIVGIDFADLDTTTTQHVFEIGAQAGILGFAASSFSIDPSVFATYGVGGASRTFNDGFSNTEVSSDLDGFTVGLRLALSGWLGGGEPHGHDAPPERDLDTPSYAPPGDPGWNQPNPNYAPPPQPAYAPPAAMPPGQPLYQQPSGQPPPTYTPPPPPPGAAPPPPSGGPPPSQAFPPQ